MEADQVHQGPTDSREPTPASGRSAAVAGSGPSAGGAASGALVTGSFAAGPLSADAGESPFVALDAAELAAIDHAARQRIRHDLGANLLVEAAAGTGKTTELVGRLVAVLASGRVRIDQVAALTFTHKAAGELKLRLRRELDAARLAADQMTVAAALEEALAHLEEARVGTIHSFCGDLLRERPIEAGVDPGFATLDEERAFALYRRTFRRWLEERLSDLPPGLRRALERLIEQGGGVEGNAVDALAADGWNLLAWRDHTAPWSRDPHFRRDVAIDQLREQVQAVAELRRRAPSGRDALAQSLDPIADLANWLTVTDQAAAARDDDALEARLLGLRSALRGRPTKGRGAYASGLPRDEVVAARAALVAALDAFALAADADLAAQLQVEFGAVAELYAAAKRELGALDFQDLVLHARDLLRRDEEVRRWLATRLAVLFVDELQDTDPVQMELILLATASDPGESDWRRSTPRPGSLLLVGDPKQSIYRFRRADVVFYQEVADHLQAVGAEKLYLLRNFRSVRPIQELVNAAFAPRMRQDRRAGQPDYVPLAEHRPAPATQPAVIALPVPQPFGAFGGLTKTAIAASTPEAVAAFLRWLLEDSGWTVEDPESAGQRVPVAPRHVAVLLRRFNNFERDVTRTYLDAFDRAGVAYTILGTQSFHEREEVEALRVAATAVEWPDDELAVYATLRGPFCACTDEQLLAARTQLGRLHPLRPPPPDWPAPLAGVTEALALLGELHRQRNQVPYATTLASLLRFGRAHAGLALRPAGHLALAHLEHVLSQARRAEGLGLLSFRSFVERLEEDAERGTTPVLAEGDLGAGVRVLTLHSAKGLEFPVVVLADPSCDLARDAPDRHVDAQRGLCALRLGRVKASPAELAANAGLEHDRDVAEGVRVAYVAATRARDLLVVCALACEIPAELRPGADPAVAAAPRWWLDPLLPALWPREHFRARGEAAPGLPRFGDTTMAALPSDRPDALRPGLHRPACGDHGVVWWDLGTLRQLPDRRPGVRSELLKAPADLESLRSGREAWEGWQAKTHARIVAGSRPSEASLRSIDANEPPAELLAAVELEVLPRLAERPRGPRFGTLVHALLAHAPLDADPRRLRELALSIGRTLGAPSDEGEHAAEVVAQVLASAHLRRAACADRAHREVPLLVPLPGEADAPVTVGEGVLDLAYCAGGEWTVVDFKTDAELAGALPRYRRQVAWYVWALRQALGPDAVVRGVLLAV